MTLDRSVYLEGREHSRHRLRLDRHTLTHHRSGDSLPESDHIQSESRLIPRCYRSLPSEIYCRIKTYGNLDIPPGGFQRTGTELATAARVYHEQPKTTQKPTKTSPQTSPQKPHTPPYKPKTNKIPHNPNKHPSQSPYYPLRRSVSLSQPFQP